MCSRLGSGQWAGLRAWGSADVGHPLDAREVERQVWTSVSITPSLSHNECSTRPCCWALTPGGDDSGAPSLAEVGTQGARAFSTARSRTASPVVRAAQRFHDAVAVDDQFEALQRQASC